MAARPIWTGTLSFGLLNVPVQLRTGERRSELHFRMLDGRNNAAVKDERKNAEQPASEHRTARGLIVPRQLLRPWCHLHIRTCFSAALAELAKRLCMAATSMPFERHGWTLWRGSMM